MKCIIFIFYIKFTLIYCYLSDAHYHESIELDDGMILVFPSNQNTTGTNNKYFESLKQFSKDDGSYFLYISKNYQEIYDSYGNYLFEYPITINLYNCFYSLVPYSHLRDELHYYIIYFKNATQIAFTKFSYNLTNDNFKRTNFYVNNILGNNNNLITCQLMKNSNGKVISCFFLTHLENEYFIKCSVFNPEENFKIIQSSQIKIGAMSFYRIESEVISNDARQKALIILSLSYNEKDCLFYAGYDIHSNNFTSSGYLIENNCSLYNGDNYYIGISYFKETEEFIVSTLRQCTFNNSPQLNYLIYSFDNNFKYSFFGILGDLVLGDSCCKSEPFKIYGNSYHSIYFDPYTRTYSIVLNVNSPYIIAYIIINKEINIVNAKGLELYASDYEYICEDYLIYYNENCTSNMSFLEDFKRLSERNYLEKCTDELSYIIFNFICDNYIFKSFEYPIECSKEYPYEMVDTHECVEYCDENALSNGTCILNYKNFNNKSITEKLIDIDSSEVISNHSDIISTEIEYKDITTYSIDTILETRNIESDKFIISDTNLMTNPTDTILEIKNIKSDNSIISDTNLMTNPTDIILEVKNIKSDNSIISDTNLMTNPTDTILEIKNIKSDNSIIPDTNLIPNSDYQTINKLTNSNAFEDKLNPLTEQNINDLFNEIFKEKQINDINLIKKIFSDPSINSKLDNIINEGTDIIISNNETTIQITSTDNQKNNKNHNISTINLGECENTLKSIYNIDPNKPLLILKQDTYIVGSNIPIVQYEVYHPDNKSKLDLSFCNNKVEINIPVKIDENNLDKYEQDSDYYNDRCYTNASDNGKDKPIEYRRKEFINNNMSLCESECDYKGYDYETKNSKCECEIKNEISIFNIKIDTERLYNQFTGLTSSNIDIIKCYYLLFKKENYIYNIGFYIILFIILLFCIGAIIFIFKGYNSLVNKIDIMIKNNHHLRSRQLKSKTQVNKRKSIKKKKRKIKTKKENNPPIKKEKNKNRNKKERTIRLDLNNESKSIRKLNSKNNESFVKEINNKERKTSRKITKRKSRTSIINKSKLITDVPHSKKNSLNGPKIYLNDYELNRLQYKDSIKYDRRIYMQYYWSLLQIGDLLLFAFVRNNDYNSKVIKICLFFFSFSLYYTVNALFFTDSTMSKIYEDDVQYDFIYQIPKIIYSNLICTIINLIVRMLSLSEKDILDIKIIRKGENLEKKVINTKHCLKIKFIFYFLVSFFLLFIFWFYVSCFCAVYKNTQIYLIKDTLISFSLSLLYPLGYYLLPGAFRLPALRNNKRECLYKISLLLQSI